MESSKENEEESKETKKSLSSNRKFTDFIELINESESNQGFNVFYDEEDISKFVVGIEGPNNTPFIGMYLLFEFELYEDYPHKPPKVIFMNRCKGHRIHPNMYDGSGKVCLSILGTWPGPKWTSALTLTGVIRAMQSLLSNRSIENEPGFENADESIVNSYNLSIINSKYSYMFSNYINETNTEISESCKKYIVENRFNLVNELFFILTNTKNTNIYKFTSYGSTWTMDHVDIFKKLKKLWNFYNCTPSFEMAIFTNQKLESYGIKKIGNSILAVILNNYFKKKIGDGEKNKKNEIFKNIEPSFITEHKSTIISNWKGIIENVENIF